MTAKNREPMSGTINQEAFERAIHENLSPDGVATAIAWLRAAECGNRPTGARALSALVEVEWLADTLAEMLGVEEHYGLMEELGL